MYLFFSAEVKGTKGNIEGIVVGGLLVGGERKDDEGETLFLDGGDETVIDGGMLGCWDGWNVKLCIFRLDVESNLG